MEDNTEDVNKETVAATGPVIWRQPQAQDKLEDCADLNKVGGKDTDRLNMYRLYEAYYDGEHKTQLLDRALEYLETATGIRYAENVCDIVVDSMRDRMRVIGWSSNPDSDEATSLTIQVWGHNNLDEDFKTAVSRTIELGDGALVVDWDPVARMPTISFVPPDMMKFEYEPDNPKKMCYAVKRWKSDGEESPVNPTGLPLERMNIYYDDRIEQYFSIEKDGNWHAWYEEGAEYWPIPWTVTNEPPSITDIYDEEDRVARGIPVFHLKNNPRGKNYGRSELHKVVPMQNSLNKLWLDFFEVADYQGYPQRYATGLSSEEQDALTAGSGTVWGAVSAEAKFGQFDAANLMQLIEAINFRYRTIAGSTSTPLHELKRGDGNAPSGEALRKAEAPLVSKVEDRQPVFGHAIGSAMSMAIGLFIDNGFAVPGWVHGQSTMEPAWKAAEQLDPKEALEVAEIKKRIGIPMKRILEELGYENVEEILAMIEDEKQQAIEAQQRMMVGGMLPTPGPVVE